METRHTRNGNIANGQWIPSRSLSRRLESERNRAFVLMKPSSVHRCAIPFAPDTHEDPLNPSSRYHEARLTRCVLRATCLVAVIAKHGKRKNRDPDSTDDLRSTKVDVSYHRHPKPECPRNGAFVTTF